MANKQVSGGLPGQLESLLQTRADHVAAIEVIDGMLGKIQSVLGGKATSAPAPASAEPAAKRGRKPGKRRRGRGSFAMSGDDSILEFVKANGTPSTKEVNGHWKSDGRGGSADNALTKLVKMKKLKRIAVKGERGSKYSIA